MLGNDGSTQELKGDFLDWDIPKRNQSSKNEIEYFLQKLLYFFHTESPASFSITGYKWFTDTFKLIKKPLIVVSIQLSRNLYVYVYSQGQRWVSSTDANHCIGTTLARRSQGTRPSAQWG